MFRLDQIFVPRRPLPRTLAAFGSTLAHLVVLVLVLVVYRSRPTVVQEKTTATQIVAGLKSLAYRPTKPSPNPLSALRAQARKPHRVPNVTMPSDAEYNSVGAIRERAKRATAALVQDFKFRTTFGIRSINEYSVAIQTEGSLPVISPDELPLHYEQYVVVEATINVDGKVVDAHIVTGEVDKKIEEKLLAAIREFKYVPAKRNGSPMPYQVDIVVHVPS